MKNAMSLKARIRNMAKQKNIPAQVILQSSNSTANGRRSLDRTIAILWYSRIESLALTVPTRWISLLRS
jgi:hypothetical protein